MTDEELIRWLRNLGPMDYELRHSAFQTAAADRIEQLVKYRNAYAEMERIATEALRESEARAELLEAALNAADQTIMENCVDSDWVAWGEKAVSDIRAALKGADQ